MDFHFFFLVFVFGQLGRNRMVARHRFATVCGIIFAFIRRCPNARHVVEKGTGKIPWRHSEIPSSEHCAR